MTVERVTNPSDGHASPPHAAVRLWRAVACGSGDRPRPVAPLVALTDPDPRPGGRRVRVGDTGRRPPRDQRSDSEVCGCGTGPAGALRRAKRFEQRAAPAGQAEEVARPGLESHLLGLYGEVPVEHVERYIPIAVEMRRQGPAGEEKQFDHRRRLPRLDTRRQQLASPRRKVEGRCRGGGAVDGTAKGGSAVMTRSPATR